MQILCQTSAASIYWLDLSMCWWYRYRTDWDICLYGISAPAGVDCNDCNWADWWVKSLNWRGDCECSWCSLLQMTHRNIQDVCVCVYCFKCYFGAFWPFYLEKLYRGDRKWCREKVSGTIIRHKLKLNSHVSCSNVQVWNICTYMPM